MQHRVLDRRGAFFVAGNHNPWAADKQ